MTTNTNDAPPAGASDIEVELPTAPIGSRIEVRRVELVAKLRDLKTDTHLGASEAAGKIKARLAELAHLTKWGIVDSWESVSDPVLQKFEQWLIDSGPQVAHKFRQS